MSRRERLLQAGVHCLGLLHRPILRLYCVLHVPCTAGNSQHRHEGIQLATDDG